MFLLWRNSCSSSSVVVRAFVSHATMTTTRRRTAARFLASSSSSGGDDSYPKKPNSKKIKINPNWEKEYDRDALTSAFEEMALQEGFDETMAYFAKDGDDDDDEDDEWLDSDEDSDTLEPDLDLSGGRGRSSPGMAARIAAARREEELVDGGSTTSRTHARDRTPLSPDLLAVTLVEDALTCTACGIDFQSREETGPGYLPPQKFDVQVKMRELELLQKKFKREREWSPDDEIDWLLRTTTSGGGGNPPEEEEDVPALATRLGIDLDHLPAKPICRRCHNLRSTGRVDPSLRPGHTDEPLLSQQAFRDLLLPLRQKPAVIIALVDLFDFAGSVLPELDGIAGENPVLLAANKADLLPSNMGQTRAENWVRRELEYLGVRCLSDTRGAVRLISCKTGMGLSRLLAKARALAEDMDDCSGIYVVGAANAGKSTLLNRLLEKHELSSQPRSSLVKRRPGNANKRQGTILTSSLPGTTLKFIKLELGNDINLYDTPGLLVPKTLTQLLTQDELKMVVPKKKVEPITFRIASGKCVLVGGLARIEVTGDSKPFLFTFFVANDIKLHPTDVARADDFIRQHGGTHLLSPPLGNFTDFETRFSPRQTHDLVVDGAGWKEAAADISLQGLGWVAVTGAGQARIRVTLPSGVGIAVRPPLMPFDIWEATARYTGGRSVRKNGRTISGKRRKGVGRR